MDRLKRFFKTTGSGETVPPEEKNTSIFGQSDIAHELTSAEQDDEGPLRRRREVLVRALRENMDKHGIPSDWLDCRVLAVTSVEQKVGFHVLFRVRKADQQLLGYVHAFQESFRDDVRRKDQFSDQWLVSVSWEFLGRASKSDVLMRVPDNLHGPDNSHIQPERDTQPDHPQFGETRPAGMEAHDDLETDLAKLQALLGDSRR